MGGRSRATSVKLLVVSDGRYADDTRSGWKDLFRRLDQVQATAPAEQRRRRGRDFEQVLNRMLGEAELAPRIRFRPVGEEIDGSFVHKGRVILLEAKWTRQPLPASSIYQFRGKVEGKLVGTIGVFISMSGFSADAVDALVAGKVINTILFDGDDMRAIAAGQVDFAAALDRKLRVAAEIGTPYVPLRDPVSGRPVDIAEQAAKRDRTKTVVVEGRFDALLVHALNDELGPSAYQLEVLLAGGTFNLPTLADAAYSVGDEPVIIIADGDGQPDAVRHWVQNSIAAASSEAASQTQVFVFDPTFEAALGIRDGTAIGQREINELDRVRLREEVRAANVRRIARRTPDVKKLLHALGLEQEPR
jgi:hypothetical protein